MDNHRPIVFSLSRYYGREKERDIIGTTVLILLIILLLLTPLRFGSVEPDSIFIIEAIAILCFLLWFIKLVFFADRDELKRFQSLNEQRRQALKRAPFFHRRLQVARLLNLLTFGKWPSKNPSHSVEVLPLDPTIGAFPYHSVFGYPVRNTGLEGIALFFLIIILFQILPLPKLLAWLISPNAGDLYESAASAANIQFYFHPLSLNPSSTLARLLQYTAYFMIYLVATNLIRTRSAHRALVYSIIISACFQASYGLYQLFSGDQQIFEYKKKLFLDCATGTFINRNHFALYVGLSLPFLAALLFSSGRYRPLSGNWFVRLSRMLENRGGKLIFLLLLISAISVGIVFSYSLTGMVAATLGCAVFLTLYQRIRRRRLALLFVVFLVIACAAAFLGAAFLKERLGGIELISERSRFMAWKDSLQIFANFPVIGTGAGTFREVYPLFRTFMTTSVFPHVHNEPLEFLSEQGVAVIFLLLICSDVLIVKLSRIVKQNKQTGLQLFQTAGVCSILILALHNLVDFSFEIPAVAVAGVIVLALIYVNYHDRTQTAEF